MIKILIICLCIYGASSRPVQSFEVFDDVENEAEVIDAAVELPGTRNLQEKRVPVVRLTIPGAYLHLYGNKNLGERTHLSTNDYEPIVDLPGVRNLEEKAIPDAVIARVSDVDYEVRHPKSQVEKV